MSRKNWQLPNGWQCRLGDTGELFIVVSSVPLVILREARGVIVMTILTTGFRCPTAVIAPDHRRAFSWIWSWWRANAYAIARYVQTRRRLLDRGPDVAQVLPFELRTIKPMPQFPSSS